MAFTGRESWIATPVSPSRLPNEWFANGILDYMLTDIADALHRPPFVFLDLWPASDKTVVIADHEIAEQVSKASGLMPWSVPKAAPILALTPLTGHNSLLLKEVSKIIGQETGSLQPNRANHVHRAT